jgi:hypothetical protein
VDVKTILVHIDASRNVAARMEFAAQLAIGYEAHLIGVTTTGVSRYLYGSFAPGIERLRLAWQREENRTTRPERYRIQVFNVFDARVEPGRAFNL